MTIKIGSKVYERFSYSSEGDFEQDVVRNADDIFGSRTIYVNMKKRVKGNNIGVIPDGYLIDLTRPDCPMMFVVENEIMSHDPVQHVGVQLLKFVTSFDDDRVSIRNSIMEYIHNSELARKRLKQGCSKSSFRNIDQYLDQAIYGDFRALVVIDEAVEELHKVLGHIAAKISVLEFRAYRSSDGDCAYEFDTLYEEDSGNWDDSSSEKPKLMQPRSNRQERLAVCDTIVVPARKEGFENVFLGENRWHAVRIGAAMRERIKYCAVYQVAPVSAVTHIAEIEEIRPWQNTDKYVITFKEIPKEIKHVPIGKSKMAPQGFVYVRNEVLREAKTLGEALG